MAKLESFSASARSAQAATAATVSASERADRAPEVKAFAAAARGEVKEQGLDRDQFAQILKGVADQQPEKADPLKQFAKLVKNARMEVQGNMAAKGLSRDDFNVDYRMADAKASIDMKDVAALKKVNNVAHDLSAPTPGRATPDSGVAR